MENEICTGSYTGEFCPTKRGPWARYYDSNGKFIDLGEVEPMPPQQTPMDRIATALEFFRARAEQGDMMALPFSPR